jgi:hypothetical protein
MAATPFIRVSQGDVNVISSAAGNIQISQADTAAVYNFPAEEIQTSQVDVQISFQGASKIQVSQVDVIAIFRGRFEDITVRAWTFTLDGHDFYVLRLNETETLIYDTSTEQWVNWDSHGLPIWRVRCGINWIEGQSIGDTYGSNIVAGDDQKGILWVLDPQQSYDDAILEDAPVQEVTFPRIVMGQVPMTGRQVLPCYALFLIGDNFGPLTDVFTPQITLEYSDDAGKTYHSAGTIEVTPGTVNQSYEWYSLGQIEAPGRLFRLTDTGVFTRIDSLTMNDAGND